MGPNLTTKARKKLLCKKEAKHFSTLFYYYMEENKARTDVCVSGKNLVNKIYKSHFSNV